ncbi:MAG: FtsX-like permease family protein [Thiotrichales bacterium]|nr:FtsX-like permease family protein [Thiotrichales bacterium]
MNTVLLDAVTATKWFFRSVKKGDWLWLMIAVILASTTVTVVKQLGDTVQQSMLANAAESIGADLVVRSSRPIDPIWQQRAQEMGLTSSITKTVTTMALSGETFQLVQLKGISENYPLRGQLTPTNDLPYQPLKNQTAWVEPKMIALMNLNPKSEITLGTLNFTLAGSVNSPQSLSPMSSFAPQILVPIEQFEKTRLLGPGSRANYELGVAGTPQQIDDFAEIVNAQKVPHWQIISARAPSEDLEKSLDTAWLFLDLAALSAVLIAGMSIVIASRFYLTRWQNSMALMRAFGAHNAKMQRLFALQLSWIALFSSVIGVIIGYLITLLLQPLLSDYFDPLVEPSAWPAMFTGFISGLLVLWSFAWQAFQSALKTSPMLVLKSVPQSPNGLHWFISFGLLLILISLLFGTTSVIWILAGLVALSVILWLAATALLKLIQTLQTHSKGWLRIALSALLKEPGLVKLQLISVGMVLFVLMLMTFVRQDMIQNWQASLPSGTPNTFIMNIQPDQKAEVQSILGQSQLYPELVPMVRGRMVSLNGQAFDTENLTDERARRLLEREANIAILENIPTHNIVVQQLAESNIDKALPGVSVEEKMAQRFNIQLGDTLTFNLSGQNYAYQVRSFRQVEWQSFQLNFFFILEPVAERSMPISYISNLYLDDQPTAEQSPISTQLTQQFATQVPGVLLIDVTQIMKQIQDIMNQASWAVSGLYVFTLLASIGVLFTATLASQQSRIQSWLLLRTLGATNQTIFKIGLTEFALLGAVAGLLAALFAQLASVLISVFLLKTEPSISAGLLILSIFSGVLLLLITGLVTQWRYLRLSPQRLKRYLSNQ